jgi:hypothetical protein
MAPLPRSFPQDHDRGRAWRDLRRAVDWLNRPMPPRGFIGVALALPLLLCLASAAIAFLRIPINNNQIILNRQFEKLSAAPVGVKTIIIGDSSAGNAIDAAEFQRLTGEPTLNLALTASFGVLNNLILTQAALERIPNVENVIFIFTAASWGAKFRADGYWLLAHPLHRPQLNPIEHLPEIKQAHDQWSVWFISPRRILWTMEALIRPKKNSWSLEHDYLSQVRSFSAPPKNWLRGVGQADAEALLLLKREIETICSRNKVGCYIMVGPLFEGRAVRSPVALIRLRNYFQQFNCNSSARWNGEVLPLPFEFIGDTSAHVRPSRKKEVTGIYAKRYAELRENNPVCPEHG